MPHLQKRITMAVLFWIFLDQICQKWIKLDQTRWNWISHQSKILLLKVVTSTEWIEMMFDFWFYWIRFVKNGSNLIKLDKIGFLTNQKMLQLKVVTFTERIEMTVLFNFDFLGSDLSKMDQTWSNLIKLDFPQIKKSFYRKFSHLQKG